MVMIGNGWTCSRDSVDIQHINMIGWRGGRCSTFDFGRTVIFATLRMPSTVFGKNSKSMVWTQPRSLHQHHGLSEDLGLSATQ